MQKFFDQDNSFQIDELQVTQMQLEQMEKIINPNNLLIDFSESQQTQINRQLEQDYTINLVSLCYLSLKKLIEISNNLTINIKIIDSEETILEECTKQETQNNQEECNDFLQEIEESGKEDKYLAPKCKQQCQLFEKIHFLVKIIQERLIQDRYFTDKFPIAKPVLFDITQIYLSQYLILCRIFYEFNSQKKFLIEHYQRGQTLFLLAQQQFNQYQMENLYKLVYNFRLVQIFNLQDPKLTSEISKVLLDFLDYHYESFKNIQELFEFEQTIKQTFLDCCLRISNQEVYEQLFQRIKNLDIRFGDDCYFLEFKWLSFYWYLTLDIKDEGLIKQIKDHLYVPTSWKSQLLQLIYYGSKRLLHLFKNLVNYQNSNEIFKFWQSTIFEILTTTFFKAPNYQQQQDFIEQLFIFILNYLELKIQEKLSNNTSSEDILGLLNQLLEHELAKENRYQKKLFEIIIASDLAFQEDKIQQYISQCFCPAQFTIDPITTAKYILICNENQCRQQVIKYIYCSIIQHIQISQIDQERQLNQIISLLHKMICYFQQNTTVQTNSEFLSQQIRLSLRLIFTIFMRNDVILIQKGANQQPNYCPIQLLDQPLQYIIDRFDIISINIVNYTSIQLISQYLKSILQLSNQTQKIKTEELYEILIFLLKIIEVIKKFFILKDDILSLNQFIDDIDQVLYKYTAKVLIDHKQLTKKQKMYLFESFLSIENFLTKNMSSLSDNNEKYQNQSLLKIFISSIFECDLENEYKIYVIHEILLNVRQIKQFPSILNKLILLLEIEKNDQSNQIRSQMIELITQCCESGISNQTFKHLLRLCFGSNKYLIFQNNLQNYQYSQSLSDQIFENNGDLVNIFFEEQLNLVSKYSLQQSLTDFTQILNKLLENIDSYLIFKDLNSYISFPIHFIISKGFTLCFEISFLQTPIQEPFDFINSQEVILKETILKENNPKFYDFINIYSKKKMKEIRGIKILISQQSIQIRQFNFINNKDIIGQAFQIYEINIPDSQKYNFQINYKSGYFTVYINGKLCNTKGNQFMEINEITKIDLGKNMEQNANLSSIFQTQSFDIDSNIFKGKMFNFFLTDQVYNEYISEQQTKIQYLIKFSDILKKIDHKDTQLILENKQINKVSDLSQKKDLIQPQFEMNSIQYKQVSNLHDILKNNKLDQIILLIFQEILYQKDLQQYESQIQELLIILFNQISYQHESMLISFFQQQFKPFIKILQEITSKIQLKSLIEILDNFNARLYYLNKKYYQKFTQYVIYDFSLFQQFSNDKQLDRYFQLLRKNEIPFEIVVNQIIICPYQQIFQTKQYFSFLESYLLSPFQENKMKQVNLYYKFVSDIQLFSNLMEYQSLSQDYLNQILGYIKKIKSTFSQTLKTHLQKYPQDELIIKSKHDVLNLTALLKACKNQQQQKNITTLWNFVYLQLFIEDLHIENFQLNSEIVDKLTDEILSFKNNLNFDDQVLDIIPRLLNEVKNINIQCTVINLIALLLNDPSKIESKQKCIIIDILCKFLQSNDSTQYLLEISNNSKVEQVFDSINCKDYTDISLKFYLKLSQIKICYKHLQLFDLVGLFRLFSQLPIEFYSLLVFINDYFQNNNKMQNQVIVLANLTKILNLIVQDCFAQDQDEKIKQNYSSLLKNFIELFQQKNLLRCNLQKKQNGNQHIENFLVCGGLFGLFTQIFQKAIENKQTQYVIKNIELLLSSYFEEMSLQPDDISLAKEFYRIFDYNVDNNGIKFPIITLIFKGVKSENVSTEKIKNRIDQIENLQSEVNNNIINEMYTEFNKSLRSDQYQSKLLQKFNNEQKSQNDKIQSREQSITTCDTNTSSIRKKDHETLCELQDQFQKSPFSRLYFDFYFQNNLKNISQFNQFILELNDKQPQKSLEDYEIKWRHTNLLDCENKIIFKKQIYLKNKDDDQQNNSQFQKTRGSQSMIQNENIQEQVEIYGTFINILNKQEVRIKIIKGGITFVDPFNDETVIISNEGCKVAIIKYQYSKKGFLIKKFDQGCQKLIFFVINSEIQSKQLKKHFSNLEMLKKMSITEVKKLTQKWLLGQLSNYQYIYLLNFHSGRNLLDKNNYFIFPWTSISFNDNSLNINRKFSQNIFDQRSQVFRGYFHSNQKQLDYFLSQNSEDNQKIQGQKYDEHQKYDQNNETNNILIDFINQLQNYGEALPEFYSNPQFFIPFQLPQWVPTQTPEEFIYIMRAQLESVTVQKQLSQWIDLIFGINSLQFKQQQQDQCTQNLNRENLVGSVCGQTLQQVFTEKHQQKKILNSYFGNQPDIKLNTKRLFYQGDQKIISIYYYSWQKFILITEKGTVIILEVDQQLIFKIIIESDVLKIKTKKNLEIHRPLTQQQICFIDFDNQSFPDKQESQNHIVEGDKKALFFKTKIFFILAGYQNGEFRSFKGSSLKQKQFQAQNASNVQCMKICHIRGVLIIGQEDGAISLWKVSRELKIVETPFLIIKSHVLSITNIDCTVSQILSVDMANEVLSKQI